MGILLKSLIAVTRATPAYKLSRKQSTDSYSIYYRAYNGEPYTDNLGGYIFYLFVCVAWRCKINSDDCTY